MSYSLSSSGLGADIRALRKSRKVTLAELAERIDRSVGWLSQVERDISTPDISELDDIATALDTPVSLLFGQNQGSPEENGRIVRAKNRRSIGDESGLVETLISPDLTDDFEVIHCTFAPGSRSKEEKRRQTSEVGYLISGKLTLRIANESFVLNSGDSFRIRDEPYGWENHNGSPAVVIWVIAPPVY